MVETIGRCDTPKESIENLLNVKQMHFPEQPSIGNICSMSLDLLHPISPSNQLSKKECNFWSCAACQTVWRLLPLMFGVIISQT